MEMKMIDLIYLSPFYFSFRIIHSFLHEYTFHVHLLILFIPIGILTVLSVFFLLQVTDLLLISSYLMIDLCHWIKNQIKGLILTRKRISKRLVPIQAI